MPQAFTIKSGILTNKSINVSLFWHFNVYYTQVSAAERRERLFA